MTSVIPGSLWLKVVQPTSGSRRPRWLRASGPAASTASTSCRARWTNPAASRPLARCSRSSSTSSKASPARSASIVMRTSHPNPGASGKHAARALTPTSRWPESGSRGATPVRSRTSSRPTRFAIPKPPPIRRRKAATARSAMLSASGRSDPVRSASQSRSGPGGAARSPAERASPFRSRSMRSTAAPAASARSAVRSPERPSTTITSASGKSRRSAATVAPMRTSSFRAATRIVRPSGGLLTLVGQRLDRRDDAVGVVADAVVTGLGAREQERERQPAGLHVDVVHARYAQVAVALDDRGGGVARGHAHDGDARPLETADEALHERGGGLDVRGRLLVLSLLVLRRHPGQDDDRGVDRTGDVAGSLLHETARERAPERRVVLDQLAAELAAEIGEVGVVVGVRPQELVAFERGPELGAVHGHVQRDDVRRSSRVGVGERALDLGAEAAVRGTQEEHGDALALEPVLHEHGVGAGEELLGGLPLLRGGLLGGPGGVHVLLEARVLVAEELLLEPLARVDHAPRDGDAEQDSGRERHEHGRQRGHVVAEAEHRPPA